VRRSGILLAAAVLAAAGQVAAQPAQQLPWALTTCLNNVQDVRAAMRAFEEAGYQYTAEDFGGGSEDVLHWYAAPDGSLNVAVVAARNGSACRVSPLSVTVAQAAPYAKAAAEQVLGVAFGPGSPQGAPGNGCNVWARVSGLNVHVETGSQGQDPVCDGGAPAQISINVTKG
jgi:hypothetical protein